MRDAVRGVGWAFLSSTTVRVLQVITTLVLAKLLMPADFGVFTLCTFTINAVAIFRDVGFAQVLIYQRGDITRSANTAFTLNVMSSTVLGLLLFASAPVMGWAFNTTSIISPVRAMSAAFLVSGAANVPLALLDREIKFKRRAIPEVASALAYAAASIGLAASGYGAWSLVIAWIIMTVVNTVSIWMVSSWRPRLEFDRREAGVIVGYGKHLMIASLAVFAFFQIDNASVGKWLGVTALGFYSMAFTVCNLPATNLAHVVNRVMFPTYSRLQGDLSEMRRVYLRTIRYISMAAFPAAIGILVLAGPAVRAFYGEKWLPAIPIFNVLAFYGLVRSIGSTAGAVFMSTGNPGLVRRVSFLQLLIVVPLIYTVTHRFGTVGVAFLFTTAYIAGTIYSLGRVRQILGIELRRYVGAVSLSLAASVLAGMCGWAACMGAGSASWRGVLAGGMVFVSIYGASLFLMDRATYSEFLGILRKSRSGGEAIGEVRS